MHGRFVSGRRNFVSRWLNSDFLNLKPGSFEPNYPRPQSSDQVTRTIFHCFRSEFC